MAKTSAAQIAAVRRYQAKNNDRLNLLLHKGDRERFREYANGLGMSLNGFVIEAVEEKIRRIESGEIEAK